MYAIRYLAFFIVEFKLVEVSSETPLGSKHMLRFGKQAAYYIDLGGNLLVYQNRSIILVNLSIVCKYQERNAPSLTRVVYVYCSIALIDRTQ